jgi:hypothetical protein
VILGDDEPNSPDPEAASTSASMGAGAEPAFEPSKPISLSYPERWFDVEASRCIEEEAPLSSYA